MDRIASYDAKTRLHELLKRVAVGEKITITKHGVPVARLVPVPLSEKVDPETTIQELKSFRRGRTLGKLSLRQMIEEGRRF